MDSLTRDWNRLSLSEQEGDMFDFENKRVKPGSMLAAKFFTKRALSIEVVARTLRPLWKTKQEFRIKDLGNHLVLFTFEDELDAERILLGAPWSFDKYLVALCRYETDKSLKELRFDTAEFWIQVHDIPARRMTIEAAEGICQTLGRVIHCSDDDETDGGEFMRVRVELDITKLLSRGRRVRFGPDSEGWVSFRYERLPIFCYWCGRLTHDAKECDIWIRSKGSLHAQQQQFGEWMRAPQVNMLRRKVISVAGQEDWRTHRVAEKSGFVTTPTTVTDRPVTITETDASTRKEGADPKEYSNLNEKAKITDIFTDREKFEAHIQEIDDEIRNGTDLPSVTKATNDNHGCRNKGKSDNTLTEMRKEELHVEGTLDHGPHDMGRLGDGPNGPSANNPTSRTWKRIITGPKINNPNPVEAHAGNKRAHDHANTNTVPTSKKKKLEAEVVEVSKMLAMEFTETAVAARQHRRDQ